MEVLKFPEKRPKKDKAVYQLPIDKIRPNPYQPRKYFNRASLEELSASILSYGVLQPITVRKMSGGYYELVAGERRLRASELAGLTTIPAILLQVSDSDSAALAFIENIQRQNLSFLEEAEGYRSMMEDYGLTQEELAVKLSKSQSSIANKLRVLKLEEPVKRMLLEYHFTERHARALLKLPDEESRLMMLQRMVREEMNVKRTEEAIQETLEEMRRLSVQRAEQREKRYVRSSDFRLFTNTIKQSVEVIRRSGMDVLYEDRQEEDCCEIVIRIRKTAGETA
ncbi:MAG: nucleoid occlusion protein [Anaerotignum sp.]|jgi:ParB family chromosome partitioning protein|nr:nucleoid occlusion protein [Anaerotignum sp.]MCI8867786.1 nucleoid occlusion protein [Anaerotignum sp.]